MGMGPLQGREGVSWPMDRLTEGIIAVVLSGAGTFVFARLFATLEELV
jgi:hypothetical protein